MQGYLVQDKIYYKIFDKTYKNSTHFYLKHKANTDDKLKEIEQNIQNIKTNMKGNNMLILRQVHKDVVIDADEISDFSSQPQGDATVTSKNKLILAIQTADCVPVLLSSDCGKIIGAAHCGWRSAKMNIISNLINSMHKKKAQNIKAIIGPSIKQQSYEVDGEYYQNFLEEDKGYGKFFIKSNDNERYLFDLPSFVVGKLKNAGIADIIVSQDDTYTLPDIYSSYRYLSHNNMPYNQNILSTIVIV